MSQSGSEILVFSRKNKTLCVKVRAVIKASKGHVLLLKNIKEVWVTSQN